MTYLKTWYKLNNQKYCQACWDDHIERLLRQQALAEATEFEPCQDDQCAVCQVWEEHCPPDQLDDEYAYIEDR